MHNTTKPKILSWAFDPVTLDDIDLTEGERRIRRVFRSIPVTVHAISLALFPSDIAALPGEAVETDG